MAKDLPMKTVFTHELGRVRYGNSRFSLESPDGNRLTLHSWLDCVTFVTHLAMSTEDCVRSALAKLFKDDPLMSVFRNWLEAPGITLSDSKGGNWDELYDRYDSLGYEDTELSYSIVLISLNVEIQGDKFRLPTSLSGEKLGKLIAAILADYRTKAASEDQWAPFLAIVLQEYSVTATPRATEPTGQMVSAPVEQAHTNTAAEPEVDLAPLVAAFHQPLTPLEKREGEWFQRLLVRHELY